jgi:hypothetical protein
MNNFAIIRPVHENSGLLILTDKLIIRGKRE